MMIAFKGKVLSRLLRLQGWTWRIGIDARKNLRRLYAADKHFMLCFWHGAVSRCSLAEHVRGNAFDRRQHAFLRQKRLLADASQELKTPLTMMRLALDEIHSAHGENPPGLQAENLTRVTVSLPRHRETTSA